MLLPAAQLLPYQFKFPLLPSLNPRDVMQPLSLTQLCPVLLPGYETSYLSPLH